jgi:virulence-associated protein VagC
MEQGIRGALGEVEAMKTAEVIDVHGTQAVKLPDEFRFSGPVVSIRKAGPAVILEPLHVAAWPAEFFRDIKIDDPKFVRPDQGSIPPSPMLS